MTKNKPSNANDLNKSKFSQSGFNLESDSNVLENNYQGISNLLTRKKNGTCYIVTDEVWKSDFEKKLWYC